MIFVVLIKISLIFEYIFNYKKQNYESEKCECYPNHTFEISLMKFAVTFIGPDNKNDEGYNKKYGKNDLSFAKHYP